MFLFLCFSLRAISLTFHSLFPVSYRIRRAVELQRIERGAGGFSDVPTPFMDFQERCFYIARHSEALMINKEKGKR